MILRHTIDEIEALALRALETDDPDDIEDFLASWEDWISGAFDEDGRPIELHEALAPIASAAAVFDSQQRTQRSSSNGSSEAE